jgi:hypothetical protein
MATLQDIELARQQAQMKALLAERLEEPKQNGEGVKPELEVVSEI